MKHETLGDISRKADVSPVVAARPMSRQQRLDRWAMLLEQYPGMVKPFVNLEYRPRRERLELHCEGTPVAVAFADPLLRAQGLRGDQLGTAMGFFQLTHSETHRLLCDCRYRGGMTAAKVAGNLHAITEGGAFRQFWHAAMLRLGA